MTEELKGTVFNGRYTLLEQIGTGGMASVYRARDKRSSSHVAVKILSREFLARNPKEAERNLRRFKREAEILRLLQGCPHIVGYVEHACTEDGDWFIAMELLEGEQLRYYLGRGRRVMGVPTVVHFGIHLLEGLKEIHSRRILHRDLAPDNVIVVKDASGLLIPKYLDFGIGKSLENDLDQVTQMLTIMGKPQYFSPEQARGLELTPASDLYSAGVLLYEMVTGHVPLEIQGIPDFRRIQREPPTPITQHPAGRRIPAELQDAIMRCLAKQPEDRPLLDELLDILQRVRERVNAGEIFAVPADQEGAEESPLSLNHAEVVLQPGDTVNRYQIKRLLGRGGMGAVYLAWDPVLHREVAVKVATRVEEERAKKALLREARASSALRCDHIVTIYDAGTEGGIPYIAMEYVNGTTLAELIETDGPLSGKRYWEVARGICEGLRFAHEHPNPVIHRDLKPANILVHRHGVKIADFGIAKVAGKLAAGGGGAGESGSHEAGQGTVATMSPEQASGKQVDHRSDLYSLGVVLYMMATGRGPFQGNQVAVLYQHCTTPPPPPSRHHPGLEPSGLDAVILKSLEKDPDRRFQSAAEMLQQLEKLFAPPDRMFRPWHRTRRGLAVGLVTLMLLLTGIYLLLKASTSGGMPSFSLDYVATPEGKYQREASTPYYTGRPEVALWARAVPGSQVKVEIVREGSPEKPAVVTSLRADDSGLVSGAVPLPGDASTSAAFRVRVWPDGTDSEESNFRLVYDAADPQVQVRTHDDQWLPLGPTLAVLRKDDIRFRLTDEGTGFLNAEGRAVQRAELAVGESLGPGVEISWKGDDQILVRVADQAGRRLTFTVRVHLIDPQVELSGPVVRTRQPRVTLAFPVKAERFDLVRHPLVEGLEAVVVSDPSRRTTLKLDESGLYSGDLPLPEPPGEGVWKHDVGILFRGRKLSLPPGGLQVVVDNQRPVITLHYGLSDGDVTTWRSSEVSRPSRPLEINQGQRMSELFRVGVDDGAGGFSPGAPVTFRFGDLPEQRLPLPPPGELLEFPLSDLPQGSSDFPVTVQVEDAVGNPAIFSFHATVRGIRITSITANERQPWRDTFYVDQGRGVEISAVATGLAPGRRLYLELSDENGRDPAGGERAEVRPMELQEGRWVASDLDLVDRGLGQAHRRLRLLLDPQGRVPVATYPVILDTTAPRVRTTVEGLEGTPPPRLVCGRFPRLEFLSEDASELLLGPELVEITTEPPGLPRPSAERAVGEGPLRVVVTSPEGEPQAGLYQVTFRVADPAGHEATAELEFEVRPPQILVEQLASKEILRRGQHLDNALAISTRSLPLRVVNRTGAGCYILSATILEEGGTTPVERPLGGELQGALAREFLITDLPGERGRIALCYQEKLSSPTGNPIPFDNITYIIDQEEPHWELLVRGRQETSDTQALADEGIRVTSLDEVEIRLQDTAGFPENPLIEDGPLPLMRLSRGGDELRLQLEPEEGWQSKEIRFDVEDLAGNRCTVHFLLLKAKDRPELRDVLAPSGQPLGRLDGGEIGSRELRLRVVFRNDAPLVTGVQLRLKDTEGEVLRHLPLDDQDDRTAFACWVDFPGEGEYELDFHAYTAHQGLGSEAFLSQKIVVDQTPPVLEVLVDGALAEGDPVDLDVALERLSLRAHDASGVKRVEWRLTAPGQTAPFQAATAIGPGLYRVSPSPLPPPGAYQLQIRAADRLENGSSIQTRSITLAEPPPEVPTFDIEAVHQRTGLEPVPVYGSRGRQETAADFYMSRTEVTVAQFSRFHDDWLRDGRRLGEALRRSGTGDITSWGDNDLVALQQHIRSIQAFNRGFDDDRPVQCVSRDVAAAFAWWAGGRLPTDEEWRNAAGRFLMAEAEWPVFLDRQLRPRSKLVTLKIENRWANCGNRSGPLAVTELKAGSPFGLMGMAGNVTEWVNSRGLLGTLGGSFKYAADDNRHGAQLGREPYPSLGDPEELQEVGIRVVWPAR